MHTCWLASSSCRLHAWSSGGNRDAPSRQLAPKLGYASSERDSFFLIGIPYLCVLGCLLRRLDSVRSRLLRLLGGSGRGSTSLTLDASNLLDEPCNAQTTNIAWSVRGESCTPRTLDRFVPGSPHESQGAGGEEPFALFPVQGQGLFQGPFRVASSSPTILVVATTYEDVHVPRATSTGGSAQRGSDRKEWALLSAANPASCHFSKHPVKRQLTWEGALRSCWPSNRCAYC